MRTASLLPLGLLVCLVACGKKEQPSVNPPPASANAAAVAAPVSAPANGDSASFNVTPIFDNNGGMNFNSVDSLIQQGQYEQALLSVMTAQRSGKATTDDSLKLQRKMQDIQGDVVQRAAAGDQRAIAAMKLLRQTAPSGR